MNSTFDDGQGSITPTMLIGLGGTGSRIVDRIAARARHLPNWESQLRPLTSFVSIDTNELDQHRLREIPPGNRINIAAFDKRKVLDHYRRSKEHQATHWLDPGYQPRAGFKPGAGQIRIESRLGFFYHSPDIRRHLGRLVEDALRPGIAWRQSRPPKYEVYMFCTLAGGTGSGSFLPMAYLVSALIRGQNWQPRVIGNLLLSTLMLDKVAPEQHPDIHANTYAALKELEHLTKLDYPQVRRGGRTEEEFAFWRDENDRRIPTVSSRPFFLSFLFDRPPHLGLPDVEAAVADASYLQIFTPIIDELASELDNYEKNLEGLTRFPGELRDVGLGYTKNFGAFGATALTLPGIDLLEYSALRFAAQALRRQITFGVDSGDADDDRARALARQAVNYSDPKFLNMSDEGRERTINEAFVNSVREMARQDESDELTEGFWYQLVESVDEGRITGSDEGGEPVRGQSTLDKIADQLKKERDAVLNKIVIKERPFHFPAEGVDHYIEIIGRLKEEVRQSRERVEEGARNLEAAAIEGEAITSLKLDPITERYLVLRLLDHCDNRWLPAAQKHHEEARKQDLGDAGTRDRLETELYESLKDASESRGFFGRKTDAFDQAKEEAFGDYRKVVKAARKLFEAQLELRQLRSLQDYLRRRARQYARLATRMDSLVRDLESEAEELRRGERAVVPPYALRVEVFETLSEPRHRIWDRVYHQLFVADGRSLSTFNRESLAATISRELKPQVGGDGKVREKDLEETVQDLRDAMVSLGRDRLGPSVMGAGGNAGLDLVRGLELEARLMLSDEVRGPDQVEEDRIADYREKKFRALAQLGGVLARVSTADSKALDDGVQVNRTRQLVLGWRRTGSERAKGFTEQLESVLSYGGRQVKETTWNDPRLVVVHDVELPIPLYYLQPLVGEIEDAYLRLAADESRSYHLHTDFRWENSLPNLNPRGSEITVGWALRILTDGLITGVIRFERGSWQWLVGGRPEGQDLGSTLSQALYKIGEIHRHDDLRKNLSRQMDRARKRLDKKTEAERREDLADHVEELITQIGFRERDGEMSAEDALDRPVLRALKEQLVHASRTNKDRTRGPAYGRLTNRDEASS